MTRDAASKLAPGAPVVVCLQPNASGKYTSYCTGQFIAIRGERAVVRYDDRRTGVRERAFRLNCVYDPQWFKTMGAVR